MSTSNEGPAAAASQQQQHVSQSRIRRPQRRTFSIGSFRFQCTRQRLIDAIVDGMSTCVEGVVYLIGPLLIALALGIISLLAYTFFFILLPMMNEKYATHPYKTVILGLHCCCVLVLIVNIVFNYAACVLQRHTGPHYDKLVRELACATDFGYPETPAQLAAYRREVSERMVQRFRRRQQHQQAQHGATAAATASASNTAVAVVASSATSASSIGGAELNGDIVGAAEGMTKRRNAVEASAASATPRSVPAPPPQPTIRSWMLMGPFEWGYCSSTNQPKPPRSHYDHVSRSLVLNLDHYCPWMFNAIGYFNYRYFLNVLIYVFVGLSYGASLLLEPFLLLKSRHFRDQIALQRLAAARQELSTVVYRVMPMMPLREERMLLTLSFMLCVAVGVAVCMLGGFHVYLTCTGQTTIEFHGNMTARQRAKAAGDPKWRNPYSHGTIYSNWQQVYGTGNPVWNILIPSRREPEFLPVPIPGHSSRRRTESPLARGSVADFGTPDASSAADSDELLATQV